MNLSMLDNLTRIANGNSIRWDILYHHRACANAHIITDCYSWENGDAAANPHIISYGDRLCPFLPAVALNRVSTMASSIDTDIWTDEAVVANGDACFVKNCKIEIGKEAFSDAYLLTIVATERLVDKIIIISHVAEQLFDDFLHPLGLRWPERVILKDLFPCCG